VREQERALRHVLRPDQPLRLTGSGGTTRTNLRRTTTTGGLVRGTLTDLLRAPLVGQSRRSGFLGIGTVSGAGTWFLPSTRSALAARTGLTGSTQRTGRACTVGTGFSAQRQCVLGVTLRRGTLSLQKVLGACGGLRRLFTRVTTGTPEGVVRTLVEVVVQAEAVLEEAVGGVSTRGATVLPLLLAHAEEVGEARARGKGSMILSRRTGTTLTRTWLVSTSTAAWQGSGPLSSQLTVQPGWRTRG